jgi:hypothetical protein
LVPSKGGFTNKDKLESSTFFPLQASKILFSLLFQANYFPIAIAFFQSLFPTNHSTRIARQSAGKAFLANRRAISQHLYPEASLAKDHLGCT